MTHLESELESWRTQRQKFFEQGLVEFESRRKLHQNRPEVVAVLEHAGHFQKALQGFLAISESLDVRDLLIGFQSETKSFRNTLDPIQKSCLGGHPIKTVVDFNRRKLFGVKVEHFALWKLLRIEAPLPLLVGVSRSADAKLAQVRDDAPPCPAI